MKKGNNRQQNNSMLLSKNENEQIFSLLGRKCKTLATAVVQLFYADGPEGEEWIKIDAGVLCLVRDAQMHSYFLRLYCLSRHEMIWEHEIYKDMEYLAPEPFLHTFEAEEHIVAFNFASDHEARHLRKVLLEKQEKRTQKEIETRNESNFTNENNLVKQPISSGSTYSFSFICSKIISSITTNSSGNKSKMKGITKRDIGLPQNVIHLSSYEDVKKTIEDKPNDHAFDEIINAAMNKLSDRKTSRFVSDATSTSLPPPLFPKTLHTSRPSRKNGDSSHYDLLPPAATGSYEHQVKNASSIPPPPLLPPSFNATNGESHAFTKDTSDEARSVTSHQTPLINSVSPPPPPPPPPPPSSSSPSPPLATSSNTTTQEKDILSNNISNETSSPNTIQDPRSELMEAIKNGTKLKPINLDPEKVIDNPRNELLSQIQQGVQLKPIRPTVKSSQPNNEPAGNLGYILKKRFEAVQIDSDESSEEDETDSDDWD